MKNKAKTKNAFSWARIEKISIALILVGAVFVRWFRLGDLLGFYYDQGRDALVINQFLTRGKFFLVGPVTGLDGIFLGPAFYLLIAPFYWLGKGNPVIPAMFISALQLVPIYLLYKLGRTTNKAAGVLAAFIYAFSQPMFWLNRWLSNPPPVMVGSTILLYCFNKITGGKTSYWTLAFLTIGLSLQFEVASAMFFIPATILFLIWQWPNRPPLKTLAISLLLFSLTLLPQAVFDFRHQHIMLKNITNQLISEKSFQGQPQDLFRDRLALYQNGFGNKLFAYNQNLIKWGLPVLIIFMLVTVRTWDSPLTKSALILTIPQLLLLLFYQGNHGNVYDYHLSGSFPIFILLVSISLTSQLNKPIGKIAVSLFMITFIWTNIPLAKNSLIAGTDGPTHITLGNQKQAVQWVLTDSGTTPFNVDVYVPPVIPYAYDYLFLWMGNRAHKLPQTGWVPLLYTLYEQDPPHPERLAAWLNRQAGIGQVSYEASFGGITVQRRTRNKDYKP